MNDTVAASPSLLHGSLPDEHDDTKDTVVAVPPPSASDSNASVWTTVQEVTPSADSASGLRLTQTGLALGTFPYMAPEQFRDPKTVDIRADIYSFGIVLFEMLASELPFKGRTQAMLQRQHTLYEPPLIGPFIPKKHAREAKEIEALMGRCLSKDAEQRFSSFVDLRKELTKILKKVDPSFKIGSR